MPTAAYADFDTLSTLLRIVIDPESDISNNDKEPAVARAVFASSPFSSTKMAANSPTISAIIISVALALLASPVDATIRANIAISVDIAIVAGYKPSGLIIDSAANAVANIPMPTVIAIIVPLLSAASLDTAMRTTKHVSSLRIAVTAFSKPSGFSFAI